MTITKNNNAQMNALSALEELELELEKEAQAKSSEPKAESNEQENQSEKQQTLNIEIKTDPLKSVKNNINAPQKRLRSSEVGDLGRRIVELLNSKVGEWMTSTDIQKHGIMTTSHVLTRLVNEKLIQKVGVKRGTRYSSLETDPSTYRCPSDITFGEREAELVLSFLKQHEKPTSSAVIHENTGLDVKVIRAVIAALKQEDKVGQIGQKRGSKYFAIKLQ